jgi:hypothetical protein
MVPVLDNWIINFSCEAFEAYHSSLQRQRDDTGL